MTPRTPRWESLWPNSTGMRSEMAREGGSSLGRTSDGHAVHLGMAGNDAGPNLEGLALVGPQQGADKGIAAGLGRGVGRDRRFCGLGKAGRLAHHDLCKRACKRAPAVTALEGERNGQATEKQMGAEAGLRLGRPPCRGEAVAFLAECSAGGRNGRDDGEVEDPVSARSCVAPQCQPGRKPEPARLEAHQSDRGLHPQQAQPVHR
jgi:hypothetical protein